jgi:hypothetical protein
MKQFRQEENGVKWIVEEDEKGRTINNYMQFDGQVLMGNWCGPHAVFRALVEMPAEERAKLTTLDHDHMMGAINAAIAGWR